MEACLLQAHGLQQEAQAPDSAEEVKPEILHLPPTSGNIPGLQIEDASWNVSAVSMKKVEEFLGRFPREPVSVSGLLTTASPEIGSHRATLFSPTLAARFTKMLPGLLTRRPIPEIPGWTYWGLSPMLRYMEYGPGGKHVPHYDAPYVYPRENTPGYEVQTQASVVLFLSSHASYEGGHLQFVTGVPEDPEYKDWATMAERGVHTLISYKPSYFQYVAFPHRELHQVSVFMPNNSASVRKILRMDAIYYREV